MTEELIDYFGNFITESRKKAFDKVISLRTRYITVVLEDIFQTHNASAVIRTCDCFGIQDVHMIENRNRFTVNAEIALGAEKWLTLKTYRAQSHNTLSVIQSLKKEGYRIIATTPHKKSITLNDVDLNAGKIALLFGTELNGLSEEALLNADEYLKVPMYGFTESLNISVTVAIIIHTLIERLRTSGINWKLTDDERNEIMLAWLKRSVKNSDLIEKQYLVKRHKGYHTPGD